MIKPLFALVLAAGIAVCASAAMAAAKRDNYVVFNIKGDCGQDDCIAAAKDALKDIPDIVSLDVTALASHQTVDYKPVVITFKSLQNASYNPVMQKIAGLGYNVVSLVIHDTHTGRDVIIPH